MKQTIFITFFLTCSFMFSSCFFEEDTTTKIIITNSTFHNIDIYPYRYGSLDSSKLYSFKPGVNHEIEIFNQRGKSKIPVTFFDYFKNVDSIIIIWDNLYSVTHMVSDSFISENKYIGLFQDRNISLGTSYVNSIAKEKKRSITWHVTYTFIEEDYIYAKE